MLRARGQRKRGKESGKGVRMDCFGDAVEMEGVREEEQGGCRRVPRRS